MTGVFPELTPVCNCTCNCNRICKEGYECIEGSCGHVCDENCTKGACTCGLKYAVTFPTLYTTDRLGREKFWSVTVHKKFEYHEDAAKICIDYGVLNGKTIRSSKMKYGLDNTKHYQQLLNEALSRWNKKKQQQKYYERNEEVVTKITPMLAHDFHKGGKDISFPCYAQPKLDGVRAILKKSQLYSRADKIFPRLNHITDELKGTDLILDGELYSYYLGFQDVAGLVRRKKTQKHEIHDKIRATPGKDEDEIIKKIIFVVYDVVLDCDYDERYNILKNFFDKNTCLKYCIFHDTEICNSRNDSVLFHEKYVKKGYEGLILRNFKGKYEHRRSKNLQKYKSLDEDDFEIVGFTDGSGSEKGLVIWIVKTLKDNKEFKVRPKGTHVDRKLLFENGDAYIGQYLNVEFFSFTDSGIPRFPIGTEIKSRPRWD